MLLLILRRQDFVPYDFLLLLKNCAKYCLDPELAPKLFQVGTGTGINHHGSTTLDKYAFSGPIKSDEVKKLRGTNLSWKIAESFDF
jgi:hypothetical protein